VSIELVNHGLTPLLIALYQPVRSITVAELWWIWDLHGKTWFVRRSGDRDRAPPWLVDDGK
jgi:hypothetical protein